MTGKRTLIIEVDEASQTATITDEKGVVRFFESVALFAADALNNEVFIQMYGASADAAWAFGRGFAISRGPEGGKELRNFYKQSVAHVCQIIDPHAFQQTLDSGEAENKWESKDSSKWGRWDSEDVLEDKQKSEAKKAAREEFLKKVKVLGPENIVSRVELESEGKDDSDPTKWN
jgi:hypothetical protein